MGKVAYTLDAEAERARSLEAVRKADLRSGDCVLVTTQNSCYTIRVLGEGCYWIWGGWFDRRGISPQLVGINGCTWGGSSIKMDIIAACGLHLEFANTVLTTRIRHIRVIRGEPTLSSN